MKKFISFVMAAVLCVGMTTTVFAANSVSTDKVESAGSVTSVKSETVSNIVIEKVETTNPEVAKEITEKNFAKDTAREFLGYENVKSATTLGYFDVEATGTGDVTFYSKNISKGDKILVLHYCDTHGWEEVTKEVGDGYVVATFHSFSPVAIVEYTQHTYEYADDTTVDETTSPKTADVAMFGLYAAVALAGTVTAARKAKASK